MVTNFKVVCLYHIHGHISKVRYNTSVCFIILEKKKKKKKNWTHENIAVIILLSKNLNNLVLP